MRKSTKKPNKKQTSAKKAKKFVTKKKNQTTAVKKTSKITKKITKKSNSKTAQTMEDLMKKVGYAFKGLKKGEKIKGLVTSISKKTILVDIGAKTEGIILNKDFEDAADLIAGLKVGDKVEAVVYSPENDKGQILLSIKQAAIDKKWELFQQYLTGGKIVEVRGLEVNRGGMIARFMGVRGFIPSSQFGHQFLGKLEELQNRVFQTKIIEVDRQKNRLIFSEKAVSEMAVLAQKRKALKKIKSGGVYEGIVSGIMPFGIFVRVPVEETQNKEKREFFLEGLVHISEISWEKVGDLNKLFKQGQKVKVRVLGIDEKLAKLNLSIKQLSADPWLDLTKKYPLEKKTQGEVIRLASFGAFVQLEPGVEGLIHISKIPADYDIKVGKKVDLYVEAIEPEKRRMSLSLVLKEKPVGYK